MRLSCLLLLFSLLFFCSLAQGYYTITPDKTFFVGDTVYCFNYTTNVTNIGKDGLWFVADDLHIMAVADNASVLVRINSFDKVRVNFTYNANRSCTIFFNCSGSSFTKEYIGGDETVEVDYKVLSSDKQIDTNESFGDVFAEDGIARTMLNLMPLFIAIAIIMVVVQTFRYV